MIFKYRISLTVSWIYSKSLYCYSICTFMSFIFFLLISFVDCNSFWMFLFLLLFFLYSLGWNHWLVSILIEIIDFFLTNELWNFHSAFYVYEYLWFQYLKRYVLLSGSHYLGFLSICVLQYDKLWIYLPKSFGMSTFEGSIPSTTHYGNNKLL